MEHDPDTAPTTRPRVGATLVDARGSAVGTIVRTYPQDADDPEFAQVELGAGPTLVPVTDARPRGGSLEVPATVEQIRQAPFVDAGRDLDPADLAALREYYRELDRGTGPEGREAESGIGTTGTGGAAGYEPAAPDAGPDTAELPPRGQEKVVPSEGPDDRPPTR